MLAEIESGYGSGCAYVIFVDSNVPMYLVGATSSSQSRTRNDLLEKLISGPAAPWLRTLKRSRNIPTHRYVAINRREAIQPAFDALLGIADQVLPVDAAAAGRAKEIVMGHRQMSARDALHPAIMEHYGIERILSFDAGFDGFPGIERLS